MLCAARPHDHAAQRVHTYEADRKRYQDSVTIMNVITTIVGVIVIVVVIMLTTMIMPTARLAMRR